MRKWLIIFLFVVGLIAAVGYTEITAIVKQLLQLSGLYSFPS